MGAGELLERHLGRFGDLTPSDGAALVALVSASPIRSIRQRIDLIREGERPRVLFCFLAGWSCRHKMLPDGRRQITSLLVPGDICDLHNHLLGRMDHSIGSITPIRVAEIAHSAVEDISARHPNIANCLRKQTLVTVAMQLEWTVNIGQRSALERLAHLFCEMTIRLRSVGMAHDNSFEFPLTQSDLADALGLTAVHVNRTLQQLRAMELVQLSGRVLTIPRFSALAEVAQFVPDYLHLKNGGEALSPSRPQAQAYLS